MQVAFQQNSFIQLAFRKQDTNVQSLRRINKFHTAEIHLFRHVSTDSMRKEVYNYLKIYRPTLQSFFHYVTVEAVFLLKICLHLRQVLSSLFTF